MGNTVREQLRELESLVLHTLPGEPAPTSGATACPACGTEVVPSSIAGPERCPCGQLVEVSL